MALVVGGSIPLSHPWRFEMMGLDLRIVSRLDELERRIADARSHERPNEFLQDDVQRMENLVAEIKELINRGKSD